ncbi:hypothetical protein LAWI1_G008426 [Lachnellula willkommii]|uniref:Gag1-like clamp domain-containing protein n=1 Tax=Lachnellula willkommii TaxID=215461 RepID=A0A559M401_9HELO|nr:hypothetical protein LAWI1_G008426 [Lachnellula willkommii]
MPQALPAASPGNAGGSPIGTANNKEAHHELMQRAEADHLQDAESVMRNGEGQPALDAPALNMALPEEESHALQHQKQGQQQATRSDSPSLHPNIISPDAASDDDGGVCATLTVIEPALLDDTAVVEHSYNHDQAPSPQGESIVRHPSHDSSLANISTASLKAHSIPAPDIPQPIPSTTSQTISSRRRANGRTPAAKQIPQEGKMHFSGKSGPGSVAYRRRAMANTNAITIYEADLTSEDRAKQKEAVKKYLGEVVKNDWEFEWPPPISTQDGTSESEIQHSEVEDPVELEWRERDDWLSGGSGSDPEPTMPGPKSPKSPKSPESPKSPKSPFRFDNPDDVGESIRKTGQERKRKRKKRVREEMEANEGLRCFHARRDAWTEARHVSTKTQTLPTSKRQSQASGDGSSTAVDLEETEDYEDDNTEIPIAPPILPPTTGMRKSITPDAYNTIYDKVVLQSLTPSCPINLKDVTRSCVQGWKRDGEWPPKSAPESPGTRRRRMSVADLFSSAKREKSNPKQPAKENEGDKKEEKANSTGPFKKFKHKIMTLRRGSTADKDKDNNGEGEAAPAA